MTEKMKPSGIAWIGDIPQGWEMSRVKYHYEISLGKMLQPLPLALTDTFEYYMCSANITWNGISLTPLKQMWFSTSEKAQYRLRNGDLLVTEGGDVAVSCIWNGEIEECYLQNAAHRVRQFGVTDNRFLYYWLFLCKNTGYIDQICNKATIAHFTKEKFGEMPLCVMGIPEQTAISDYLDIQCAKIDSVIADIENQIETLQKYKKSLITETVTKGLDRVVPMKDSGVACIGLVPQNWTYKKLGYMAEVTKLAGFEFTDYFEYVDEGVIAVRGLNLKNFDISLADVQHIPEKTSDMLPRSQINYNDVLISYAGTVGSVGLVTDTTKRYHLAPNVGKVTVLSELIPRYLAYYLISYAGQEHIDQLKNKNAQESISMENIRRIKVLVPSQAEQQNICDYLDEKVNEVDAIISGQQKKLELMHAHKKSLIYEYVTGKKRVTEVN